MSNVKILLLPSCTKANAAPASFSGCRSFTVTERRLLSPLPLHLFDWQMVGKMVGGERVGGQSWDYVSRCVCACSRHYLSSQQMRWERPARRGWALFKSLFMMPTEATLAFPNGASQARHLTLGLVIPVPLSVVSALLVAAAQDSENIGIRTDNSDTLWPLSVSTQDIFIPHSKEQRSHRTRAKNSALSRSQALKRD